MGVSITTILIISIHYKYLCTLHIATCIKENKSLSLAGVKRSDMLTMSIPNLQHKLTTLVVDTFHMPSITDLFHVELIILKQMIMLQFIRYFQLIYWKGSNLKYFHKQQLNPLNANPTKWFECFLTVFWGWRLKG